MIDPNTIKFKLFNRSPFLGTIIFNLLVEKDDNLPTAATDGIRLYYNEKFWDGLSNKEKLGILAHEVGHCFSGHIWRAGERKEIAIDPTTGQTVPLWGLAADYAVNLLVVDLLGSRDYLPKDCLYDLKYKDWSAERIYEDLKKSIPNMTSKQLEDLMRRGLKDSGIWDKLSRKERSQVEGRMKQIIQQGLEAQRAKGKMPAILDRMYHELEPKEDWRKILMDYIQPYFDDYNFMRPDRRFLTEEFYLPDIQEGQKIDWIAVAIDTSGSIGPKEMDHFVSEIKAILGAYDKVKIKLTFCDAEATPFLELEGYDKSKIRPKGGGGTDFRPVFDLVSKEDSAPQALLYFTDLEGSFPARRPEYDVLWISTSLHTKVPFGKVVDYLV